MSFFYVMNGRKMKQYLLIFVAALFSVGIFLAERDHISVFSPKETGAIYSVTTDKPMLALTFDISWGDERPEPIVNILKDKGVTNATFFISSPWSQAHPEIVKKIVDAGFEIGSHGHKYANYSGLKDEEIRTQIRTAHHILEEATGKTPKLLRLPNGDFDKRVLEIAKEMNYTVIQWSTDSQDLISSKPEHIVNRVVTKAHPGDIVLLHASDSAKHTQEALPEIIDQLKQKGFQFVTVSELISQTNIKGKKVETGH